MVDTLISKIKCRVCGNLDGNKEHIVAEMMYGMKDKFSYTECAKCGCLQISQIPSNLSNYYPSNYYSYQFKLNTKEKIKIFLKAFLMSNKLWYTNTQEFLLIDFLCQNDFLKSKTKVLDVGCGAGFILLQLKYLGFNLLQGIDPFISSKIDYGNGVSIDKKYLHEVDEVYDLVMLNHSYEHMVDPAQSLLDISRILSHDGFVSIRIPIASFAWQHYGVNWVQIDAPRHVYLHTIESMNILAMKTGFEIVSSYFDSTEFQFWGSEQYAEGIALTSEKSYLLDKSNIFTKIQIKEYSDKAQELNEKAAGDQACFILKKKYSI
jgi:2-polyprenyl-3-methyl-5-hydroxy-6-metoxy-1,4-benzoquinol methylase